MNFPAQVQACPSLLAMRDQYILQFSEKRKLTTLSKTNKAVEVLLSHLRKRDIPLKDINRTIVTGWLDKLKSDRAPQTIQNYISAPLKSGIWPVTDITTHHRITHGVVMVWKLKAAR